MLPLFNAAVDVCSVCCCLPSTKTDVGKLLTNTAVDVKMAKMANKLKLKNLAIFVSGAKESQGESKPKVWVFPFHDFYFLFSLFCSIYFSPFVLNQKNCFLLRLTKFENLLNIIYQRRNVSN